jgi:hypothetical protein
MRILVISMVLTMVVATAWAQPGNPGENPFVPVTGGILYLVAAGLGYGFYAIRKKMKDR